MPRSSRLLAHDREQARELGEDERLLALLPQARELLEQHLQLGARVAAALRVDERGVARGLPQPEERLEHVDLGSLEPALLHLLLEGGAVVGAQRHVERLMRAREVDHHRLLGAIGQVLRDLPLGAPQDEGAQRAGEQRDRLGRGAAVAALGDRAERGGAAEHAGVQELEERPELAQVVLDRGAGEREAVVGPEQARGLGGLRAVVLDGLRLVEDGVAEIHLRELDGVAAERAVGGEDQVVVREARRKSAARSAPV